MIRDPFTVDAPLIAASILSADFAELKNEIEEVMFPGGADLLHLDIMDGHFVPNISFGPVVCSAVRRCSKAFLVAHLMITDPVKYTLAFLEAGVDSLTFHVEATDDPVTTAREIRKLGCKRVGITLNPATPIESIYPALDEVDLVLIMSVVPGFAGQKFMPEVLQKCEQVKKRLRADQRLEIDGGINFDTIKIARDAGVDWFVAASAIFDVPDRSVAIAELRKRLETTDEHG